ncbi:hypothetical protein TNCV_1365711 [Trichonephila clavipes]|nr:hypothetical protein TNCV_1365711 [Trichonephila clavipes]
MELNWVWIIEISNSFHISSSLCHTSSTELTGEEWWASLSATHNQIFQCVTNLETELPWGTIENTLCIKERQNKMCAAYSLALSCWKMAFGRLRRYGTTTGRKTTVLVCVQTATDPN